MAAATAGHIRVIAIAVVRRGDALLVVEGFDAVKGSHYYRPLGGGVEPGERAAEALAREFREELGTGIANVRQLAVLENIFACDGRPGHEVVFLFEAELTDRSLYERDAIDAAEDDGGPLRVVWRSIDAFDARHRLVPEGLAAFLGRAGGNAGRAV